MSVAQFLNQLAHSIHRTDYTLNSGASLQVSGPVAGASMNVGAGLYTVQADNGAESQVYISGTIGAGIGLPGIDWGISGGPSSLPSTPGRLYSLPGSMGGMNTHSLAGATLSWDCSSGGTGAGVGGSLVFIGGGSAAQQLLTALFNLNATLGVAGAVMLPGLMAGILLSFQAVTFIAGVGGMVGTPGASITRGTLALARPR